MPTPLSHPAILLALHPFFRKPELSRSLYWTGAVCSILPDLDVIGFNYGIHYGDLFGHRGFSHSLFFAALVSLIVTSINRSGEKPRIFLFLFLCSASHGFLDAFTDGGLGVAFFSPFSNKRYFFPWRPLKVSPIGLFDFLLGPTLAVIRSEFLFVWLPSTFLFLIALQYRKNHDNNRK